MKTTITLQLEKETKNKYRYHEITEPGKIPILEVAYIPKSLIPHKPTTIQITIDTHPQ